jgi:hypothetical protein
LLKSELFSLRVSLFLKEWFETAFPLKKAAPFSVDLEIDKKQFKNMTEKSRELRLWKHCAQRFVGSNPAPLGRCVLLLIRVSAL